MADGSVNFNEEIFILGAQSRQNYLMLQIKKRDQGSVNLKKFDCILMSSSAHLFRGTQLHIRIYVRIFMYMRADY